MTETERKALDEGERNYYTNIFILKREEYERKKKQEQEKDPIISEYVKQKIKEEELAKAREEAGIKAGEAKTKEDLAMMKGMTTASMRTRTKNEILYKAEAVLSPLVRNQSITKQFTKNVLESFIKYLTDSDLFRTDDFPVPQEELDSYIEFIEKCIYEAKRYLEVINEETNCNI